MWLVNGSFFDPDNPRLHSSEVPHKIPMTHHRPFPKEIRSFGQKTREGPLLGVARFLTHDAFKTCISWFFKNASSKMGLRSNFFFTSPKQLMMMIMMMIMLMIMLIIMMMMVMMMLIMMTKMLIMMMIMMMSTMMMIMLMMTLMMMIMLITMMMLKMMMMWIAKKKCV